MATIFVLLKVLLKNVTVIIYCSFSTLQLGSANKSVEFVFSPSSDVKNRGKKTSHFFWSGKPLLNPTLYYFFNCSVKILNQQSICGTWIDAGAFFFFLLFVMVVIVSTCSKPRHRCFVLLSLCLVLQWTFIFPLPYSAGCKFVGLCQKRLGKFGCWQDWVWIMWCKPAVCFISFLDTYRRWILQIQFTVVSY